MCVHIILCLGIWTEHHLVQSFLWLRYTKCASGCMLLAAKRWSGQFASATAGWFHDWIWGCCGVAVSKPRAHPAKGTRIPQVESGTRARKIWKKHRAFSKEFDFVFQLDDEQQVDPNLYILDLLKPFRPSEDLYSQICSGNCGNDSEYAVGNPWSNCTLVEFHFGSHWIFFSYKYTCIKIHPKSWASSLLDRSGRKATFPAR